ncbi:MAG: stage II sporulation protein P [Eubacteriales bacterium]|nr:stage II sporulation protein P [Eubacteriales bacterium]
MKRHGYRRAYGASSLSKKAKKLVFCQARDRSFFIKAALYSAIALLLMISVLFVGSAGETASGSDIIVFNTVDPLIDASGDEGESIFESSLVDPKLILSQEMPVIYGVDLEEVYIEENVGDTEIYFDVLPEDIKLEILEFTTDTPKEFFVGAEGPQILIYHTHTQEAYRQIEGEEYVETGSWRTADENQSVVAVGEALKKELEEYGYTVLHDTTNHEPPKLSTSYSRSLETMLSYAARYQTISVYIDVHRDAYGNVEEGQKDYVTVNGEECARVMFVVGTGEGKTGEGFDEKPNYESNYKLALALTNELESIQEGFTRPIRVKTGRYNQHVSDMCLLIEVGHNANSLEQALNTAKYIALALSRVLDVK